MFVNRIGFATLISKPTVYSMEVLKVFASTMKTNMIVKAPQDFVAIVIQNAEEELAQPLVNLLALHKNVLILIHYVVVILTVKLMTVFVLVHRQNILIYSCYICGEHALSM